MKTLPTRKVNGVGRVFEREMDAIGIKTCGDIYAHRHYLRNLFGEKASRFLMQCYLGLGRTSIQPAEEYERKSVGTESTFREMSGKTELREKLKHIAEELEQDLERTQYKGRTLVLKVKLHTYEVLTRQIAPPKAVHSALDLYKYALPMLTKLEKDIPDMKLRLMGLRVTHIVSTKKAGTDFFGLNKGTTTGSGNPSPEHGTSKPTDDGEWEVWPETEFEQAARQERQDEMNDMEALSQEYQELHGPDQGEVPSDGHRDPPRTSSPSPQLNHAEAKEEKWQCPVCSLPQTADDRAFNSHIDFCLSRGTIKDAVKSTSPVPHVQAKAQPRSISGLTCGKRKRGRPRVDAVTQGTESAKRKPFFS